MRHLYYLGALIILAGLTCDQVECLVSKLLDLPGGFKLKARIVTHDIGGSKIDEEIVTTEYYSNEQRRSRIDVNGRYGRTSMHSGTRFKYIFDEPYKALLKITKIPLAGPYCIKMESILYDLFGEMYREEQLSGWQTPVEGIPGYVNGLARLVLIIEANRDKMEKQKQSNATTTIRNHQVQGYTLNLNNWTGKTTKISAWYTTDTSDAINLPIRVYFATTLGSFFIEYSFFEELSPLGQISDMDFHLDLFAFPVGFDCSKQLDLTLATNLTLPQVVSMQLEVEDVWIENWRKPKMMKKDRLISRHFVAYDGLQHVLRQDNIKTSRDDGLTTGFYSTTIHDLKTSKYYNIGRDLREQPEAANSTTSKLFNKMNLNLDSDVECVVTRASPHFDYQSLLPLRELTDMGVAFVRGIKTRVLEHRTNELPPLIFQQVMYKNYHQQDVSTSNPDIDNSDTFTVVYYLSHDFRNQSDRHIGPLIRVDLIHNYRKIYQVDVYDMVWQLAEAPNGDHQTELFSIQDHCSSGDDLETQTTLSMEMSLVGGGPGELPDETRKLIENPLSRNKAIIRALAGLGADDISGINLQQLESRVRVVQPEGQTSKGNLQLLVTAKVAKVSEQIYSASTMATVAGVTPEAHPIDADNFAECFWQAAHARSRANVLFAYFGGLCFIDFNPSVEWNDEEKKSLVSGSNVFRIDWKAAVSRVELLDFGLEKQTKSNKSNNIYDRLSEQVLDMPFVNLGEASMEPVRLRFQVSSVELSNNKWQRPDDDEADLLDGLGLVGGIEPKLDDHSQADLSSCRSACMADLSCRSYSVCVTGQGIECKTTGLPFRDADLLSLIKKEKEKLKKIGKSTRITLDFKPNTTTTDSQETIDYNPEGSEIYALKMDKKCRVYNKRALEMFNELPKSLTSVENRNIREVRGEEECAELCVSKNVKYFRRMAKLRLSTFSKHDLLSEKNGQYMEKLNEVRKQYAANLKSWCSTFKYLNMQTRSLKNISYQLKDPKKSGICLLSQPAESKPETVKKETKLKKPPKVRNKTKMDTFEFNYRSLFRMHPGVRLLEVQASNTSGQWLENQQKAVEASDLELCSRQCFIQTVGLTPFCKSFDMVETRTELPNQRFKTTYCVFNSVSLSEARGSDNKDELISSNVELNVKVYHFEPRDEYMLDGFVMTKLLDRQTGRGGFTFSAFNSQLNLFLVVVVGLVSGVALGHYLRGPIGRRLGSGGPSIPVDSPLDGLIENDNPAHQENTKHDGL